MTALTSPEYSYVSSRLIKEIAFCGGDISEFVPDFVTEAIKSEELNNINNFFVNLDNEFDAVKVVEDDTPVETNVSKYITSLVSNQYQKSIEDIENTKVGNKRTRKRNLQQVMRESFFSGANRFGNNFIA